MALPKLQLSQAERTCKIKCHKSCTSPAPSLPSPSPLCLSSLASMAPHNNGVDSGTRSYEISRRKADCKFINSIKCYCSCFEMSLELSFPSLCVCGCCTLTTENSKSFLVSLLLDGAATGCLPYICQLVSRLTR